jgi:hypothetical protein
MEHVAIDLGGRESQVCVRAADGTIVEEKRCRTRELGAYLATRWILQSRERVRHPPPAPPSQLRAKGVDGGAPSARFSVKHPGQAAPPFVTWVATQV